MLEERLGFYQQKYSEYLANTSPKYKLNKSGTKKGSKRAKSKTAKDT